MSGPNTDLRFNVPPNVAPVYPLGSPVSTDLRFKNPNVQPVYVENAAPGVYNVLSYPGAVGDDVNDDTAAFQAALAAAGANPNGGIVYAPLPPVCWRTSASLVIPADNVAIIGAGYGTIIKPVTGANFDVISTAVPASVGLAGFIRNFIGVQFLTIDCSRMSGTTAGQGNGIHFYGARYSYVSRVKVLSCKNWSMLFDGDNTGPGNNFSYNIKVEECVFDLASGGNIYFTNSEAGEVTSCQFKFAGAGCAAAQPVFNAPDTVAMHLRAGSGYLHAHGNVFGNGGTYTTECVRLSNSGPCLIIGNRFDQPRFQAVYTPAGNHVIANNQIGNASQTGTVEAIRLASDNNLVIGNKFDITNGAAHWTYCVLEAGGPYTSNIIADNEMLTGTSGFISLNAASTAKVHHNTGYNPVGHAVPQPAVPASGTAQTNNSGVDCTVYVAGGTVTAIAVSGTATGATSGAIRVPSGATITLTYSVAPTWQWFGD